MNSTDTEIQLHWVTWACGTLGCLTLGHIVLNRCTSICVLMCSYWCRLVFIYVGFGWFSNHAFLIRAAGVDMNYHLGQGRHLSDLLFWAPSREGATVTDTYSAREWALNKSKQSAKTSLCDHCVLSCVRYTSNTYLVPMSTIYGIAQ